MISARDRGERSFQGCLAFRRSEKWSSLEPGGQPFRPFGVGNHAWPDGQELYSHPMAKRVRPGLSGLSGMTVGANENRGAVKGTHSPKEKLH